MRPLKLLNLLVRNAKRGEFRAEGNTIFLYDFIVGSDEEAQYFGGVSAQAFIQQLSAMKGPVTLRINSPGGEVMAASAMAQAIAEYPDKVVCMVDGLCASAATYLAINSAECVMAAGAFFMIHKAATMAWGNSDDFLEVIDMLERIDGSIAERYATRTGSDKAQLLDLMAKETWYGAQEAVDAGFADSVSTASQRAQNRWDLTAFDQPPSLEVTQPLPEPGSDVAENLIETPAPAPDQDAERAARIRQTETRLLAPAA